MMTINGVDISTLYGSKIEFFNYEIPSPSVSSPITTTDSDRKQPSKRKNILVNNLVVKLVMYDEKENCYIMASKLASLLSESLVNFGGILTYKVQIASDGNLENLAHEMFMYTMQLQVLDKMGEEITVTSTDSAVVLVNDGTYKTPITITITPLTTEDIYISGYGVHTISNPIIIDNITIGRDIILDGENCMISENNGGVTTNKFSDAPTLIQFPEIPVGSSTLLFVPAGTTKTITYRPRYV